MTDKQMTKTSLFPVQKNNIFCSFIIILFWYNVWWKNHNNKNRYRSLNAYHVAGFRLSTYCTFSHFTKQFYEDKNISAFFNEGTESLLTSYIKGYVWPELCPKLLKLETSRKQNTQKNKDYLLGDRIRDHFSSLFFGCLLSLFQLSHITSKLEKICKTQEKGSLT